MKSIGTVAKSYLQRVRQNHALEHATINLLSRRYPGAQVVGFSSPAGFTLYSSLTTEDIILAARQALSALQAGESELAVHENCGTNLVITAALTTLATVVGFGAGHLGLGRRRSSRSGFLEFLERLPQAVLLNAIALVVANPIARWVQSRVTTDPDASQLEISSIFTDYYGTLQRVRVHTRRV